jgi:hypothetical protein
VSGARSGEDGEPFAGFGFGASHCRSPRTRTV